MKKATRCPSCGAEVDVRLNPYLTVDIIIEVGNRIVLIERGGRVKGWALPGGFVDYGETLEAAAKREAKEETGLDINLGRQFHAYSDPSRDPRQHNVSVVFTARAEGEPVGGSDARQARLFTRDKIPPLAFDHNKILDDYFNNRY